MTTRSKIYIAGHRGMVGSPIVRQLLQSGVCPESLIFRTHAELDLTNQAAVQAFFAAKKTHPGLFGRSQSRLVSVGQQALLVANEAQALAADSERLLNSPSLRLELGLATRQRYLTHFRSERTAWLVATIYTKMA
jgi:hypothetical protein